VTVVSAVALFSLIKTAQVQKFAVLCSLVPPIEKLAELGQPRKTANAPYSLTIAAGAGRIAQFLPPKESEFC
jgi:hypothetical protein